MFMSNLLTVTLFKKYIFKINKPDKFWVGDDYQNKI